MIILERLYKKIYIWICHGTIYNDNRNDNNDYDDNNENDCNDDNNSNND